MPTAEAPPAERESCFDCAEQNPFAVDRDAWQEKPQSEHVKETRTEFCLTVVVLGATGDLAKKKTFPSLAGLWARGFLPDCLHIIGYARSDYTDDALRDRLRPFLPGSDADKDKFLTKVTFCQGQYDKDEGFQKLQQRIGDAEVNTKCAAIGRLFYLALPPPVYPTVLANIKQWCSNSGGGGADGGSVDGAAPDGAGGAKSWLRVIVEKPFGKDLGSSEELSARMASLFAEEQIYRIDHYLGKELSQNMLLMRWSNTFLSSVWDRKNIDNIQIIMKEDFGTEGRGGYFDEFGIIRDVMQNHLLQLLALVTMERPVSMHPDDIRDEKTKVVRSMKVIENTDAVIGQYTAANGKPGYKDDEGVAKDSITPTYAVVRISINNERWEGVPMLIKAGKALNETKTEVRVQFKTTPGFFGSDAHGFRNEFVMQLKPRDAMYMKVTMKKPGLSMEVAQAELNLTYGDRFDEDIPEAYERLILNAIQGNQQHFLRRDELRASWALFTPLLHAIDAGEGPKLHIYKRGSRGVEQGDQLVAEAGYIRSKDYKWQTSPRANL